MLEKLVRAVAPEGTAPEVVSDDNHWKSASVGRSLVLKLADEAADVPEGASVEAEDALPNGVVELSLPVAALELEAEFAAALELEAAAELAAEDAAALDVAFALAEEFSCDAPTLDAADETSAVELAAELDPLVLPNGFTTNTTATKATTTTAPMMRGAFEPPPLFG